MPEALGVSHGSILKCSLKGCCQSLSLAQITHFLLLPVARCDLLLLHTLPPFAMEFLQGYGVVQLRLPDGKLNKPLFSVSQSAARPCMSLQKTKALIDPRSFLVCIASIKHKITTTSRICLKEGKAKEGELECHK